MYMHQYKKKANNIKLTGLNAVIETDAISPDSVNIFKSLLSDTLFTLT